jgi:hypothetical protein
MKNRKHRDRLLPSICDGFAKSKAFGKANFERVQRNISLFGTTRENSEILE